MSAGVKTPAKNGHISITDTPGAVEEIGVHIPRLQRTRMRIKLVGDSTLVTHAWSEKAKRMMLEKQTKTARQGKEAKDPVDDFLSSLYWLTTRPKGKAAPSHVKNGKFAIPAIAFKKASVDACRFVDGMKMTVARGAFHVVGDLVEIHKPGKGSTPAIPEMREDMVRLQTGVADIRYRGEFKEWAVELDIEYNAAVFSPGQIINLFNNAGFGVGVGENRPEKNGEWGRFHVDMRDVGE